LASRHVIAITGTHGKNHHHQFINLILTQAGLKSRLLIGGVAADFAHTAALEKILFRDRR